MSDKFIVGITSRAKDWVATKDEPVLRLNLIGEDLGRAGWAKVGKTVSLAGFWLVGLVS